MKLLAIDGNSIVNRAYYGIKLLSTKDGIFTNAIYGFLSILLRMQQETSADMVVITFDMRAPTFRHKKFDGYKAQRKGMPDELAQQMPYLRELLAHLGYPIIEKEGYEADDLLGTLSRMCAEGGEECVIATGDRDSFQLIGEHVSVRLASTKGGKPQADVYDEAVIMQNYGVTPQQLIEVKALMGDASDNIPGVAGVGEKTALGLIQKYGGIGRIYGELDELEIRDNLREKLRKDRDMAFLSRELAEIDRHVPITETIESLKKKPADNAGAYKIMSRLELFSMMDRFGVTPVADDGAADAEPPASGELEIFFNELPDSVLGEGALVDVLFKMDGHTPESFCVQSGGKLYLIDTDVEDKAALLLTSKCKKRVNNIKLLHHFAISRSFEISNVAFDAEIAAYILNPTSGDYSIERLAAEYGVIPNRADEIMAGYSGLVSDMTVFSGLCGKLYEAMEKNGQIKLFTDIELPLSRVLADMEHSGFAIDSCALTEYGKKLDNDIARLQDKIYGLAGESFNLNSPKQLGVILFEKLGLPKGKKTKTGYSTNAEILEELADSHEIVRDILDYRKAAKLKSTYVDGLLKVAGEDGRIHTSFQQTLTRTGRISSTEPNMQNIPVRTELGRELRKFFVAGDGMVLLDADYSQIELRVLAHISDDAGMIKAFIDGEDIHTNTASQVFGLPPGMVTPDMRRGAKAVNFGIVYGIGAFSLSKDIGVSVAEADRYIKGYLSTYSGVRQYMDDIVEFGSEYGYVKTLFNRRRYLPELASSNRINVAFGKRVAMNTPIQGTAADIIKIAMVRVYNRLREEGLKSRLILQVHDELIVESPKDEAEAASAILREEMENAAELSVPLEADVGRGASWYDAK